MTMTAAAVFFSDAAAANDAVTVVLHYHRQPHHYNHRSYWSRIFCPIDLSVTWQITWPSNAADKRSKRQRDGSGGSAWPENV